MSLLTTLRQKAESKTADLPALIAKAEKASASIITGEHTQRRSGLGEKFWQFREYQAGDRPQDIDWRQSAKGDRIFIRQKEWQTTQTSLFWTNNSPSMDYHSHPKLHTKKEEAAIMALALALLMKHGGEQVGWLLRPNERGRSDNAINKLGRSLLETHPNTLPPKIKAARHSTVFVISDFLDPIEEIDIALKPLSERVANLFLVHILDPAELGLPFNGRVIFENAASTEHHHINNVKSIRRTYQNRINHHNKMLRHLCRKQGWAYGFHGTNEDMHDILMHIWATVMGKPI